MLPRFRRESDARAAGALFQRLPDGVIDGKALRGGEALGQGFGFLRELNHACNLAYAAAYTQCAGRRATAGWRIE